MALIRYGDDSLWRRFAALVPLQPTVSLQAWACRHDEGPPRCQSMKENQRPLIYFEMIRFISTDSMLKLVRQFSEAGFQ